MVGPGGDKTSQLVNGSDVIRLMTRVLDLNPSFIFLRKHNELQSHKWKKMIYMGSGKRRHIFIYICDIQS